VEIRGGNERWSEKKPSNIEAWLAIGLSA